MSSYSIHGKAARLKPSTTKPSLLPVRENTHALPTDSHGLTLQCRSLSERTVTCSWKMSWTMTNKQLLGLSRSFNVKDGLYLSFYPIFFGSERMLFEMTECLD